MPFLRRLFLLALLGGVLLLFGKILIFLFVLFLGFALVGFLIWMPLHSIFYRPNPEWKSHWNKGLSQCRRFVSRCQPHMKAARDYLAETQERLRTFSRWLGSFLVEILSGAALGCLVMLLRLPEFEGKAMALGILVGAAAGFFVALFVTTPQTSLNHE